MTIEMIFNELSLHPLAPSRDVAKERVKIFLETIQEAVKQGVSRQLRTQEAFKEALLADGYSWRCWLSDGKVPKELHQYFLSLATRSPYLDGLLNEQDRETGYEFFFADQPAEGLGVAFLTGNLSLSLSSDAKWAESLLELEIKELQEEGEILEFKQEIHHASKPEHVLVHQGWIQNCLKMRVSDGVELWEKASVYFPSLIFCLEVQSQMQSLPKEAVSAILRGLMCLETYCKSWQTGNFNQSALGCSSTTESEPTLCEYAQERTFVCPEDKTIIFNYHVKLGKVWRICYDPSPGPGWMYVGYVGRHLRTVKYH